MFLTLVGIQLTNQPYSFQGSLIDPPVQAVDFVLESSDGGNFRLSDFRGKTVLLYFGYTYCPDVCPTTLFDLARAKKTLGDVGNDLVVAMITVDPKRDDLDVLGEYVRTFDPSFFGLSAESETLEAVWTDYGVYRAETQALGGAEYLVDHTARVYVIDSRGRLRLTFPFGMSRESMADDLRHLINE
jgi:protein SCO1/2